MKEYRIEKYEGTQVGYGKPSIKSRTRKISGFTVTDLEGYTRFFDTKKEALIWIDEQTADLENDPP